MNQSIQAHQNISQNLEAVTLYVYEDIFLVESNTKLTNVKSNLIINRKTHEFKQISKQETVFGNFSQKISYSVFLGLLPILNFNFLVFVSNVERVCTLENKDIFQLRTVQLVPLESKETFDKGNQETVQKIYGFVVYLKDYLLKSGYYFSYGYDLTLSKSAYAQGYPTRLKYAWNAFIGKSLFKLNDRAWFVILIQGSIKSFKDFLQGKKIQYILITRRSWKKGGTRYNSRGIDSKGNVANFCETQQIIYINNYCFSHVQIRGSVPLFWKQTGIYAEVNFYRNHEENKQSYKRHFAKIQKIYDKIFCINLLCKQKSGELELTMYFEQLIKEFNLPNLRYQFYDLHFACKGEKFERANYLITKLAPVNKYFKYYTQDLTDNKVIGLQQGIMRTNCLDCLDRTNLIQSKIAYYTLDNILLKCGFDLKALFNADSIVVATSGAQSSHSMIVNLKNIWADNGDMISIHYTGTPSTHTDITRTGKRDYRGMMNHGFKSLTRFYKQYMEDNSKQQIIDILIGQHTETINLTQFETRMKSMNEQDKNNSQFIEI